MTTGNNKPNRHVDLLVNRISAGLDYSDHQLHRKLYDHIKANIVPTVSPAHDCPPLPVIVYAIRNVLEPTLHRPQIVDLLNLLGHVNVIRKSATVKAQAALKRNRHYQRHPQADVSILHEDDRVLLEHCVLESDQNQRLYRQIVHALCQLDVYYVYTESSPSLFLERFSAYFPGLLKRDETASKKYLFHYDLTEEEQSETRKIGERCAQFASKAAEYLEDPVVYCRKLGLPEDLEFGHLFECPNELAIVDGVERYLHGVESMVQELERLFGWNASHTEP